MGRILWRDAQGIEGTVDIAPGAEARIGRATECVIRTDDAMVSRQHARIIWRGDGCYVEDMGSANGVYFQEHRVTSHLLRHGDAVRCGSLWFRFIASAAGAGNTQIAEAPRLSPAPTASPAVASSPGELAGSPQRDLEATGAQLQPPGQEPRHQALTGDAAEHARMRRRIEQLQAELRIYRGGSKGQAMEELEHQLEAVEVERDQLAEQARKLRESLDLERADDRVRDADALEFQVGELVGDFNDLLSSLRINVTAAADEFEQFADVVKTSSYELIRESLRAAGGDVARARDLLRELRTTRRD